MCIVVSGLLVLLGVRPAVAIRVTNVEPDTVLRYPVALIVGHSNAPDHTMLTLTNQSSQLNSRVFKGFVYGQRFKALAELVPGPNHLTLSDGRSHVGFRLRYQPMTTPYVVRIIYVTDDSESTTYPTQKDNDPQDYRAKLSTVAKLMQTLTAESLHAQGLGRKTFRLEFDERGEVAVHTVKAPHPASYYQSFKDTGTSSAGLQLYREMGALLEARYPTRQAKNIVIMGVSSYNGATRTAYAHTALGGGGLGVFSNLSLFSWPSSLQEVQKVFETPTPVDPTRTFDDSAFRSTLWGLASTTMGATLHEMGHTLGLPHSPQPFSIMSRGFDRFNRVFTLREPSKSKEAPFLFFKDNEVANFERVSAQRLAYSDWLELDARPDTSDPTPTVTIDETGRIIITAPGGLRFLGIDRGGLSQDSIVYPNTAPRHLEWSRDDLIKRAGGDGFALALIDDNGHQTYVDKEKLQNPLMVAPNDAKQPLRTP